MKVIVYSTTTCPYCKLLKDYLNSKNLQFTEKLVDMDDVARDEMVGVSGGFMGVPFSLVIKDDGVQEKVIGFDQKRLDEIISTNNTNEHQ